MLVPLTNQTNHTPNRKKDAAIFAAKDHPCQDPWFYSSSQNITLLPWSESLTWYLGHKLSELKKPTGWEGKLFLGTFQLILIYCTLDNYGLCGSCQNWSKTEPVSDQWGLVFLKEQINATQPGWKNHYCHPEQTHTQERWLLMDRKWIMYWWPIRLLVSRKQNMNCTNAVLFCVKFHVIGWKMRHWTIYLNITQKTK